jgi:hypothetical protein
MNSFKNPTGIKSNIKITKCKIEKLKANPRSIALEASTPTITQLMRLVTLFSYLMVAGAIDWNICPKVLGMK